MMSFSSRFLALTTLALTAGACGSDSTVATSDDLEQARVRHYRIGAVELPLLNTRVREMAFDLGGSDTDPDNQLGSLHATIATQSPAYQVMPEIEEALAGELVWMLSVYDDVESGGVVGAHLAQGRLDGNGQALPELGELPAAFADLSDPMVPLAGEMGHLPLGTFADALGGAAPGWIDGRRLRIVIDAISDTALSARIGLAVPHQPAVDEIIVPNLAAYFTTRLAANDSDFAAETDTDDDGVVSEAELGASSAVQALLHPDLFDLSELEGGEGLSIGFAVTGDR